MTISLFSPIYRATRRRKPSFRLKERTTTFGCKIHTVPHSKEQSTTVEEYSSAYLLVPTNEEKTILATLWSYLMCRWNKQCSRTNATSWLPEQCILKLKPWECGGECMFLQRDLETTVLYIHKMSLIDFCEVGCLAFEVISIKIPLSQQQSDLQNCFTH